MICAWVEGLYSEENIEHRMGCRRVDCLCPQGEGHNAKRIANTNHTPAGR